MNAKVLKIVLIVVSEIIVNYFIIFHPSFFPISEFESKYSDEAKERIAQGEKEESGHYIYGNYMTLDKGKYEIVVHGISEADNVLEVYHFADDKRYYSGSVQPGKRVNFDIDQRTNNIEIRILYQGEGALSIDGVSIRKCRGFGYWGIVIILNLVTIAIMVVCKSDKIVSPVIRRIIEEAAINILIIVSSVFLIFCMEAVLRNSFFKAILWIEGKWIYFATTVFFVVLVIWGVRALNLFNWGIMYFIIGVLVEIFALVEYNYYAIRGEAFTLAQLSLVREGAEVMGGYSISIPWPGFVMIFWILDITILAFLMKKSNASKFRLWVLPVRILAFLGVCVLLSNLISGIDDLILRQGEEPKVLIAKNYYDEYGYIFGLISTCPVKAKMPHDYTEQAVKEIIEDLDDDDTIMQSSDLPDIIFIQEESLYDLSMVLERTWKEDPLDGLKKLQEEYTSGIFLSPTAGGGTCNVEYEVLTGYPYANTGGSPYVDMIRPGMYSLVDILENAGYKTVAMHSNTGSFFNRSNVYQYLGFDDIFFSENMPERAADDIINSWANDKYIMNFFMDYYEERRETDSPLFAHIVTTQNHGGYDYTYLEHGIYSGLEEDDPYYTSVNTYLNLEKESCVELEKLLQYFESVDRKVIVVYWGDHAPGLSMLGWSAGSTVEDSVLPHMTPLLIWNNYGLEGENLGIISGYKIAPYVLKMAHIETDTYMNYMNAYEIPNVVMGIKVTPSGQINENGIGDEEKEVWENLWMLQYDRMFGRRYSME